MIPTRITAAAVIYHDPMPPARIRKSTRIFRSAYDRLGSNCVVCSRPEGESTVKQSESGAAEVVA